SRQSNLFAVRMTNVSPPFWGTRIELCRPYDADYVEAVFGSDAKRQMIWFHQKMPDGSSYAMVIGVIWRGGSFRYYEPLSKRHITERGRIQDIDQKGDRIWINLTGDMDVFVGVATSYEAKDPLSAAKAIVAKGMRTGYDLLKRNHRRWWADFWKKSFIQFHDPLIEQLWYMGLYQAGSSLGRAPVPGLCGLWYGYHDQPVQGFFWAVYTMDQDIQIASMPVFATNHPDLAHPFMDTFLNALPITIAETRRQFNLPGACFSLETAFLGGAPAFGPAYRYSFCGGPFCGILYVWAYRYTQDKKLLKAKIYPYLREVVRFFAAFMEKGNDGRYHLPPTVPAEIYTLSRDAIADISLLKPCLVLVIEASRLFNVETEERKKWEDILQHYPEYPVKQGIIMDGADIPMDHISHNTYRLYPLILGHETDPQIIARVANTLHHITPEFRSKKPPAFSPPDAKLQKAKSWDCSGWPWFFFSMARLYLGMKSDMLPLLREEIRSQLKPNGLFPHIPAVGSENKRYREMIVTTPENNSAFTFLVTEMLMQSRNQLIRVFPGIAGKPTVRFGHLRAQDGFLVSAEMEAGRITFVSIEAERNGQAKIQNPWPEQRLFVWRSNGKREILKAGILNLAMRRGEKVTLSPAPLRKAKRIHVTGSACPKTYTYPDGTTVRLGKSN
ncbi:MAG: hypothetical protein L6437_04860, partial [Kiritimatiellae bacterium]|nr:hypothetical protein [Kiritimatiellia bacterium]